jgi:hypothetical protein
MTSGRSLPEARSPQKNQSAEGCSQFRTVPWERGSALNVLVFGYRGKAGSAINQNKSGMAGT